MTTRESQLMEEIGFWRELISDPGQPRSGKSLERMQRALALAERKLEALSTESDSRVVDWEDRSQPNGREQ
jgi:hypothetical protein